MFQLSRYCSFFIALVLFSCNNSTPATDNSPSKAVIDAFNTYKAAVLQQDGGTAVSYLSANSIEYYNLLLQNILEAEKATVQQLSSGSMLQVLAFRHLFLKEELLSFDGKTLYQAMVERQLLEEEQLANTTLGKVAVKGNKAKGQMVLSGEASPIFFDFQKEDTGWKIDVTTTIIMTSRSIENAAKKAGLSVPDYLENLMQLSEEEQRLIWTPLRTL